MNYLTETAFSSRKKGRVTPLEHMSIIGDILLFNYFGNRAFNIILDGMSKLFS